MKFTKNSKVNDVLKGSPAAKKVFDKYNLDCPQCKGSIEDSIYKVAENNGLDLDSFLKELNAVIDKK